MDRVSFLGGMVSLALDPTASPAPSPPSRLQDACPTHAAFSTGAFEDSTGSVRPYRRAGAGPPVMVLHEIFGLSSDDLAFCSRLASAGFTVYAPLLLGAVDHPLTASYKLQCFAQAAASRAFRALEIGVTAPVTRPLLDFARQIARWERVPAIGVVGLCLTGNLPLSMLADEIVAAGVLAEPSLPFRFGSQGRADVHVSDADLRAVDARVRNGLHFLGFRFDGDDLCPPQRFETLSKRFGSSFESSSLRPEHRGSHSVFATDYACSGPTLEAFTTMTEYFRKRLTSRQ